MKNLWSSNSPARFWLCHPEPPEISWYLAIQKALPVLDLPDQPDDPDHLLSLVLGEGRFGTNHWQLSTPKRIYYIFRPILPRVLTQILRRLHNSSTIASFPFGWPIEDRYVRFQWELMKHLLLTTNQSSVLYRCFWPKGYTYAFAITHDIESRRGQLFAQELADLDESFGFRSSFNFVPELYPIDYKLIENLKQRGFEIGLHGLKHDGKLFNSFEQFTNDANEINSYLHKIDAVGFRSPQTIRNPIWMQALDIDYDLSFFDTDPYEPIPGGTMSIWPFILGRFVELPYTLAQDNTLINILGERTPRLWLEKVDFIEKYHGLVLLNTHPDYLLNPTNIKIYIDFLQAMKQREHYWHALPKSIAHWWRSRSTCAIDNLPTDAVLGKVQLSKNDVVVLSANI